MSRLKHFRVAIELTQKQVASVLGVSQPTYQRWESGALPVPPDRMEDLARILGITAEALSGRAPPLMAAFNDESADADIQYFGEVAIHFSSGTPPLIISISEGERERIYERLEGDETFFALTSLGNDRFCIRQDAVSEICFSSEAHSDHRPEHFDGYDPGPLNTLCDPLEWAAIEDYFDGLLSPEDADLSARIKALIGDYSADELAVLAEQAGIGREGRPLDLSRLKEDRERIRKQAIYTWVQLSSGALREFDQGSEEAYSLSEFLHLFNKDDRFVGIRGFHPADYHRDILFRAQDIDYLRIPRHKVEAGADDDLDEAIEDAADRRSKAAIQALPRRRAIRREFVTSTVIQLPLPRKPR
jgi:transcriptional regulator with XRE-family HTH domain